MNLRTALAVTFFALGAAGLAACEDDHDHDHSGENLPPSCEEFHEDCVKASRTSAAAAACDDFTHAEGRTEEQCAAKKAECIAICRGGGDAGAEGGADAATD